jgi:hypothetical protein
MSHGSYIAHTRVTSLGEDDRHDAVALLDLSTIPSTVRSLVVHMDQVPGTLPTSRTDEPAMRRVSSMMGRLQELDQAELNEQRPVERRLVGHCRTSSVLAVSFYRELGAAARVRCGFSVYYADGRDFYGDHWVVELWNAPTRTWRLLDTELDEPTRAAHNISFDPANVPRDQLILAGQAWIDCRAGSADPTTFGPYPDQTGWRRVADQLLRDVACLCGSEVGPFDSWLPTELDGSHEQTLDALAAASTELDVSDETLRRLCEENPWVCPPDDLTDD